MKSRQTVTRPPNRIARRDGLEVPQDWTSASVNQLNTHHIAPIIPAPREDHRPTRLSGSAARDSSTKKH